MAVESLAWPAAPTDTDEADPGQSYNMGVQFSLNSAQPIPGVEWRVPDAIDTPPSGTHAVSIWNRDTGVRLAYKEVVPTPGGVEQFLFDVGDIVAGTTGVNYVAAVYTTRYVFRSASSVGVQTPSGTATADTNRIAAFNGGAALAPIPVDASSATFYISPLVGDPDGIDAAGALTFQALQLTGSGGLDDAAAAALTLPALTLAGAGSFDDPAEAAFVFPALQVTAEGASNVDAEAALALPALQLLGEASSGLTGTGALLLPALRLVGAGTAESEPTEPETSRIPGMYDELVAGLRAALAGTDLKVAGGVTDAVDRRTVVIGPPSFAWEGLCDPDEPSSVTFQVYLVEAFHERATKRLLANLPVLIRAVQGYNDATITAPAVPGAFASGSSDLPCYQLTVEMTL